MTYPPEPTLDDKHRYAYKGLPYVGVTSILKAVGIIDYSAIPPAKRKYYMDRGTQTHLACQLDDAGTLNEDTVDPVIMPYLEAWRWFKRESGVVILPEWTERKMVSVALGYAGMMDREVMINQLPSMPHGQYSLDIKNGKAMRWTGVQLAAYSILRGIFKGPRIAVELHKDGTYKVIWYTDDSDYETWFAVLKVYSFGRNGK